MIEENGGQTQRMNNTNEKFENEGKCFGRTLIRMVDLKRQLGNEIEINSKMLINSSGLNSEINTRKIFSLDNKLLLLDF